MKSNLVDLNNNPIILNQSHTKVAGERGRKFGLICKKMLQVNWI